MPDRATPNLPSRDFEVSSQFYRRLGFAEDWRDDAWMILSRGGLTLEFFPHPELNPAESWFSCCLRVDDLPAFYAACLDAGLSERCSGWPRLHPPGARRAGSSSPIWSTRTARWSGSSRIEGL